MPRQIPDRVKEIESQNPGKSVCYGCDILFERKSSKTRECKNCRLDRSRPNSVISRMKIKLSQAKINARFRGQEFSIKLEDVLPLTENCPVFNVPFDFSSKMYQPSLDRKNSFIGYTKDNVQIISWRANDLKKDGELWEFEALVEHMRKTK